MSTDVHDCFLLTWRQGGSVKIQKRLTSSFFDPPPISLPLNAVRRESPAPGGETPHLLSYWTDLCVNSTFWIVFHFLRLGYVLLFLSNGWKWWWVGGWGVTNQDRTIAWLERDRKRDGQMDRQIEQQTETCEYGCANMNARLGVTPPPIHPPNPAACLHVLRFERIHINLRVLPFFLPGNVWPLTVSLHPQHTHTYTITRTHSTSSLYILDSCQRGPGPKKKTHLSPSFKGQSACVCVCIEGGERLLFTPGNPCCCSLSGTLLKTMAALNSNSPHMHVCCVSKCLNGPTCLKVRVLFFACGCHAADAQVLQILKPVQCWGDWRTHTVGVTE